MDLNKLFKSCRKIAMVGVGNEDKGDDGAGVEIVRRLQEKIESPNLLLIEAGKVPENFTKEIKEFEPVITVLIDAADFGGRPGEVIFAPPDSIRGAAFSTHTLPLSVLADYIQRESGSKVFLLGIQPKQTKLGEKLSAEVESTVSELAEKIAEFFNKSGSLRD